MAADSEITPYTVFTTQFDKVVTPEEIRRPLTLDALHARFRRRRYQRMKHKLAAPLHAAIDRLSESPLGLAAKRSSEDIAVTLLVDHSGSLKKGILAHLAVAVVEALDRALDTLDIQAEILGFTTESWRGGASRALWKEQGRPPDPGRLCDLLHIVYRSHGETRDVMPELQRVLFRHDLIKENVDGEALAWAASRLSHRDEPHKLLIVISDGAPVDDSTLLENSDSFLANHLKDVIRHMQPNVVLAGVGLGYAAKRLYGLSVSVSALEDIPEALIPFLQECLSQLLEKR